MADERKSFWETLPGILTAIATLLGAIGGFILIMRGSSDAPAHNTNRSEIAAPENKTGVAGNQETSTQNQSALTENQSNSTETAPPQPQMGPLVNGMDYPSNDINQGENFATAEQCRALCQAVDDCKAMTYIAHSFAGHNAGECWLKKSADNPTNNPYTIAAKKRV